MSATSTDILIDLLDEFYENTSEIETAVKEFLGIEYEFISKAYGFDADLERIG